MPVILGIIRLKLPAEMPPAWYTAICAIAVIFLGAAFVISLVSYTLSIPGEDKTKGFATRALRLISAVTFGFGFVLLSASETKDYWTLFSSKFPIRPVTLLFILLALSACIFSFLHIWFSPRSGRILKKIGHAFLNVIKTIFLIVPTIMVAYLVFFQIYTAFVAGGGVLWGIVVIVCTLICIALSLYLYLPTAIYLETFTDLTFRNEPRFGKLFVLKEEPEKDSTGKQEKRAYDWRGALLRATLSIDYPLLADFHFCNYQPQATVVGPFGFLKVYVEYKSTSFPGNEQLLEMVKTQLDKALDDYSQMSQGRVPKKYRVFLKVSPRWESDDTEFTSFPVTYTFTFRP